MHLSLVPRASHCILREQSFLRVLVRKYYAPFLVHPATKIAVMVLFVGFFAFSLNKYGFCNGPLICCAVAERCASSLLGLTQTCSATQVELGLDQQTVMPDGSYMITYFDAQEEYQEVCNAYTRVFSPPSVFLCLTSTYTRIVILFFHVSSHCYP